MRNHLVTDMNEDTIEVGAKVRYVGPDDVAYDMEGFVESITDAGYCLVEFDAYGYRGVTYDILPTNLELITVEALAVEGVRFDR